MKNPITTLSDFLNNLVIEHGSAVIQEKHIALLKEQFAILERENTKLTVSLEKSETENKTLKKENIDLKKKIETYEKSTHANLLDEIKAKTLLVLSKQDGIMADNIAQILNIDIQVVKFHLEELKEYRMVYRKSYSDSPSEWYLNQEGRRYLIENKLIS